MRNVILALIAAAILMFLLSHMRAQHNHAPGHAQGHSEYEKWQSQKTGNCCSNQDCAGLPDTKIRETRLGPEVQIDGQWCPVLSIHRLIRGKSPDWSVAHACISKNPELRPCDKLLCYIEKGGL